MPRTIFLIGAGRSGTTLLYKILSLHPALAFLSNYNQRYPGLPWLSGLTRVVKRNPDLAMYSWFGRSGQAYFMKPRKAVKRVVPTPSEGEAVYAMCGYIPARTDADLSRQGKCLSRYFDAVRTWTGCECLISKRTANNWRLAEIDKAFPDALYIHLVRDGRDVAYSLMNVDWWPDHRLGWMDATPRSLVRQGMREEEIAARNWVEEMRAIEKGIEAIGEDRIYTLRYEQMLEDPHKSLKRIFKFIGLRYDENYKRRVDLLNLRRREPGWKKVWNSECIRLVKGVQGDILRKWGYLS